MGGYRKRNRKSLSKVIAMRVAVIIDTWFPVIGGGQINAWEISRRLAQKNLQVDIITRHNGPDNLKPPKNLHVLKLGGYGKPFDALSKILFVLRAFLFLFMRNYDLIHAHAFLPGIVARLLLITKGIPSILTVHGTAVGTKLNNPVTRWLEKFILTKILYSGQITVSRDFIKIKNINKQISYVPNGVNTKIFDNTNSGKSKFPTLLFVGRLHPQKNLPTLVSAVSLLKQENPDLKLIIAGPGDKKALQKLIRAKSLQKSVVLAGVKTGADLVKLYRSSHLFVLPSVYEGLPLTLLEAWAAKTVPVVTKSGDCQYLVKEGINGFLIEDPLSVPLVAAALKKALKTKTRAKIAQNGYNLVKADFTWEKAAQKTLNVYQNLIKG